LLISKLATESLSVNQSRWSRVPVDWSWERAAEQSRVAIPCATLSPPTCWKRGTLSERYRAYRAPRRVDHHDLHPCS